MNMRLLKTTCLLMVTVLLFWGCWDKKDNKNLPVVNVEDEVIVSDSTVYGECVDAMMNSITLLTNSGDTVDFVYDNGSETADVQGGAFQGDKMAVIGVKGKEENFAQKVINVTTLLGRWTSLDKNFEIKDGGVVESNVSAETNPYTSWKILNGKLILSKDTFDIVNLGPDSLYLENDKGIFAYKRQL